MSKTTLKPGSTVTLNCTDQTGLNGTFECEVKAIDAGQRVHFERPRGDTGKPVIHGGEMLVPLESLG